MQILTAIVLITLGISAFWTFRARAANEADQFEPIPAPRAALLPKNTGIDAIIPNGVPSSSAAGNSITAFVSAPVSFHGNVAIPTRAQLNGHMKRLSAVGDKAKVEITFDVLTIRDRSWPIQALPIVVTVPIRGDAKILVEALRMLVTAGISAGIGASSMDERLFEATLGEGIKTSLPVKSAVPITVILEHDLQI